MLDDRLSKVRYTFDPSVGQEQRTAVRDQRTGPRVQAHARCIQVRNALDAVSAKEHDPEQAVEDPTHVITMTKHLTASDALKTRIEDGIIQVCTVSECYKFKAGGSRLTFHRFESRLGLCEAH